MPGPSPRWTPRPSTASTFARPRCWPCAAPSEQLALSPDFLLIDGRDTIDWDCPQQAVIHGDATSFSIAAASVLAKVYRDRLLVELDREYPGYGLAQHKGYPCPAHLAALERLGPTPLHRKSFHPVAQSLLRFDE